MTDSNRTPIPTSIVPGDDAAGLCPTLIVNGVRMHDPIQPYREVLPLEGKEPEVIALFGVGLGYTAAGALLLAPQAKVVAWEPIPEMAELARRMLREEWNLHERVVIETDLADFQARLLDAVTGAASLSCVELEPLAQHWPELTQGFRSVVTEVVDADTLGAQSAISSQGWAHIGRLSSMISDTPLCSSLASVLRGRPAIVISASTISNETISALRIARSKSTLFASAPAARILHQNGIDADLVLVHSEHPPADDLGATFAGSVLAITPESHPTWWSVPCSARMLFGHSAVSWMFSEGDPSAILNFKYGELLPLSLTAIAFGAKPITVVGDGLSPSDRWNRLHAFRRTEHALHRCAQLAGAEFVSLAAMVQAPHPPISVGAFASLARLQGRALDPLRYRTNLAQSRRAVARLAREHRQLASTSLDNLLSVYLQFRAEGHPFTRSFLVSSATSSAAPVDAVRREAAFGLLDWIEEQLPPASGSSVGTITSEITDESRAVVRVFIAGPANEETATRTLLWSLDKFTQRRVEIRHLKHELAARLGPRSATLPAELQALLVPALCNHQGRAIFVQPTTLLLEDIGLLWDQTLNGHAILVPGEGPISIALIDAGRSTWRAMDLVGRFERGEDLNSLLSPSNPDGSVGKLPSTWCERDRVKLDTAATRFTCGPWLPWKRDLHPLTWLWEFQLLAALEDGYLSRSWLDEQVEKGGVRASLAALAARVASTASSATATPERLTTSPEPAGALR
jgi:hypothetical protein